MIGATSLCRVADSYFVAREIRPDGGRYLAGPATEGPWDPRLQHGGPPTALAVSVAEDAIQAQTGRDDLVALRVSADFVGAVPVDELDVQTRILRAARSAALVEVTLSTAEHDHLVARIWFVRDADTESIAPPLEPPRAVPDEPGQFDLSFPYANSLDCRFLYGRMRLPGPAAAWVRPTLSLVAGREMSGLTRVALIGDSASGISAELDFAEWSFLNVDLDIHLARPMRGEWLLLEAATQLGPRGSALTRSTLSDANGLLGAGLQTLVVSRVKR